MLFEHILRQLGKRAVVALFKDVAKEGAGGMTPIVDWMGFLNEKNGFAGT